jgi:PleD family two-component response regulator
MTYSAERSNQGAERKVGRILNREAFLYFLDLEVKRARRYQNFFYILVLKLNQQANRKKGESAHACYQKLLHFLNDDLRESDILASLGEDRLAALLPYTDLSAGGKAKSRFEGSLKFFNFENEGYKVSVDKVCFPVDGTDTSDLIRKVIGPEAV